MELVDRRTYRSKKPINANGFVDDRTVMAIMANAHYSGEFIKFDGPNVRERIGYQIVTRKTFEKWASHDVTEQLPAGCYMTWEQYKKNEEIRVCKKLGIA